MRASREEWPARFDEAGGASAPSVVEGGVAFPAERIRAAGEEWLRAFGSHLVSGDRILVALPPRSAFVSILLAAHRGGFTVALAPPGEDLDGLAEELDAKAVVAERPGRGVITPGPSGEPVAPFSTFRVPVSPPTPRARYLLRTSGTAGHVRWIALSERNVASVLESHLPLMDLEEGTVVSVLPWHHAFGLVLDLLASLQAGARIVLDPAGGRDPDALVRLVSEHSATHLNGVPLTLERLAGRPEGATLLKGMRGVVGGAPVSAELSEALQGTLVRVGYGQTEASPGITLGEPGEFSAGWLGRPVGCEAWLGPDGVLAFRGPNACLGVWHPGRGLEELEPGRGVVTGDFARSEHGGFVFEGRESATFKLANGRSVDAGRIEQALVSRAGAIAALLGTSDGHSLELAVTMPGGQPLPESLLARCLDPVGSLAVHVRYVPPEAWIRTRKGEIDRRSPPGRESSRPLATS